MIITYDFKHLHLDLHIFWANIWYIRILWMLKCMWGHESAMSTCLEWWNKSLEDIHKPQDRDENSHNAAPNQSFFLSPSSDWAPAGVAAFPENGQDRLPLAVAVPFEAGHALLPSVPSVFLSVPSVTLPHGFQNLMKMGCRKRCQMNRRTGTTMQGMHTIAAAAVEFCQQYMPNIRRTHK